MGKIIVITSGKGGVGKTTVTANVGIALSLMGNNTVVVDTDLGLRNLDLALGMENLVVNDIIDVANSASLLSSRKHFSHHARYRNSHHGAYTYR